MKLSVSLFLSIIISFNVIAQHKYWITFKDKSTKFDPYSYFDERAIEQRLSHNIPLSDSTDYPVNQFYLTQVASISDSMSWSSRWLNGVAVFGNQNEMNTIASLPFVSTVQEMEQHAMITTFSDHLLTTLSENEKSLLHFQTQRMQGDSFIENHYDGKGLRIAVFDVGFPGVDRHPAFEHLRNGKQIVATYDFVCHKEDVYKGHWHGTATLSCIAGKIDSVNIGLATGAEFFLARTERMISERFSEEENWLAAAEWADKQGVNIISSSLGYTYKRYFNTQMDGITSLVARAATIASSKGILVVNAAGNEGDTKWHYIDTPGDADSVLTVGGTDPETDIHIYFSSFGPTSSGKLKPNVCALGKAITATNNGMAEESGTSFSTPLVAGFAACAWQSHRHWSNMELFDAIEKSSHLYPYFDYVHGFGIPQAGWFLKEPVSPEPTFDFVVINDEIKLVLREKYSYPDQEEAFGYKVRRNFFYKIEDKYGVMKKYTIVLAENKEMLHFLAGDLDPGDILTVHFEGYTSTVEIPEEIKQ